MVDEMLEKKFMWYQNIFLFNQNKSIFNKIYDLYDIKNMFFGPASARSYKIGVFGHW